MTKGWAKGVLTAILLGSLWAQSSAVAGQELVDPLTEPQRTALAEAADFFRTASDLDGVLAEVGFRPDHGASEWGQMTPEERLGHVARRAEVGQADGARLFLRAVVQRLARDYGAARVNSIASLAPFVDASVAPALSYPALPAARAVEPLPPDVDAAIAEAARLLAHRPTVLVLREVFAMDGPTAERFIGYRTFADVLRGAVAAYETPQMRDRLVRALAQHIVNCFGTEALARTSVLYAMHCARLLVSVEESQPAPYPPPRRGAARGGCGDCAAALRPAE